MNAAVFGLPAKNSVCSSTPSAALPLSSRNLGEVSGMPPPTGMSTPACRNCCRKIDASWYGSARNTPSGLSDLILLTSGRKSLAPATTASLSSTWPPPLTMAAAVALPVYRPQSSCEYGMTTVFALSCFWMVSALY
ncbi:hypothetical protein D3C71_1533010 [compost metagenome]